MRRMTLVREIAILNVKSGKGEEFEKAYDTVASVLNDAEGSHGATLHRGVEEPDSYTLIVEWDSVDDHVTLTGKPEFERFGSAVGEYLAGQPEVRHIEPV
jgi:heme-degrading monooxygenase HmoA